MHKQPDAEMINQALAALTPAEREVVKLRCGLADGYEYSSRQIGRILKMPEHQVQRIETEAFRRLRAHALAEGRWRVGWCADIPI